MEKTTELKEDVEKEKSLLVKLGIAFATSVVVGSAAWFGIQDKRVTVAGVLASLALAFVVQK